MTSISSPPLSGSLQAPGDKSVSHRALILGALAKGETRITGLLESLDVLATLEAVRALGAEVGQEEGGSWSIVGRPWRAPTRPIDCGNSGTSARLLMGACAGFPLRASFVGDKSLSRRPMQRVLAPLEAMGARVAATNGCLPVTIEGGQLNEISYRSPVASAQVKSALLLAGLRATGEVEIYEPQPSRDHTERMLRDFGCDIDFGPGFARLGKNRLLTGTQVNVPSDPSSAAFPMVAALIVPDSRVLLRRMLINPLRNGLLATLREMGARIRVTNQLGDVADVEVFSSPLRGVDVPFERVPSMIDEYPVLAVAAACAEGRTVLRGLGELRVKESDRLAAIVMNLEACGVRAFAVKDDLVIEGIGGRPRGGARAAANDDHRIAMAFLVLGLAAENPVKVDSAGSIATSFPGFAESMRQLGARIR